MYKVIVIGAGLCIGAVSSLASHVTQDADQGSAQSSRDVVATASSPKLPAAFKGAIATTTLPGAAQLTTWADGGAGAGYQDLAQDLPAQFPNNQGQTLNRYSRAAGGISVVGNRGTSHRDYVNKIKKAESDDDREKAIEEARGHLEKEYDRYVESTEKQIEALQQRLETLKDHLEKRKDAKDRLVDLKLELLISEADGIGWPSNNRVLGFPGGGSGAGGTYMIRPSDGGNAFFDEPLRVTRPPRPTAPAKPRRSGGGR